MVSRRKQGGEDTSHPSKDLIFEFEPVHLPEAENNERIRRLARQILDSMERARKERRRSKKADTDFFAKDFDELFGLKKSI